MNRANPDYKRILVLALVLVVLPSIGVVVWQLIIGDPPKLSWIPLILAGILAWTTFGGTVAEITGYSLRDFLAGEGKWQSWRNTSSTRLGGGMAMQSSTVSELEGELEHRRELLTAAQAYHRELELQIERQGDSTPPAIRREHREYTARIEQLKADIEKLENRLRDEN